MAGADRSQKRWFTPADTPLREELKRELDSIRRSLRERKLEAQEAVRLTTEVLQSTTDTQWEIPPTFRQHMRLKELKEELGCLMQSERPIDRSCEIIQEIVGIYQNPIPEWLEDQLLKCLPE